MQKFSLASLFFALNTLPLFFGPNTKGFLLCTNARLTVDWLTGCARFLLRLVNTAGTVCPDLAERLAVLRSELLSTGSLPRPGASVQTGRRLPASATQRLMVWRVTLKRLASDEML